MPKLDLSELKTKFETGDKPTSTDFIDLIDSLSDSMHIISFSEVVNITGSYNVNFTTAAHQKLTIIGNTVLTLSNWPVAGLTGELLLELVNAGSKITWPVINWIKADGSFTTTFSTLGVTLQTTGTDFIAIWSHDGGVTYYGKVMR